jgi:hypothetical protein
MICPGVPNSAGDFFALPDKKMFSFCFLFVYLYRIINNGYVTNLHGPGVSTPGIIQKNRGNPFTIKRRPPLCGYLQYGKSVYS